MDGPKCDIECENIKKILLFLNNNYLFELNNKVEMMPAPKHFSFLTWNFHNQGELISVGTQITA